MERYLQFVGVFSKQIQIVANADVTIAGYYEGGNYNTGIQFFSGIFSCGSDDLDVVSTGYQVHARAYVQQ